MEQMQSRNNKRTGWSEQEANLLWETADEAQQQGLPLKQVFERIAQNTGRRPNSIRNYYYAQARARYGDSGRTARFVPFTEDEVTDLMQKVLRAKAGGQSVRACLQQMAHGDHSLMLRYQNKYRSVLKSRPELVASIVEQLNREGVECQAPTVNHRRSANLNEACSNLMGAARQNGDADLVQACETLARYLLPGARPAAERSLEKDRLSVRCDLLRLALSDQQQALLSLCHSGEELIQPLKEYLAQPKEVKVQHLEAFCADMLEKIGPMEEQLTGAEQACRAQVMG